MTALVTALCFVVYFLGYRLYAGWLARRVFSLDPSRPTPAHTLRDDVDYVPTGRWVLFGHHYASITGLSPMLGPAVAVIWGWAPALAWVVLGGLVRTADHQDVDDVLALRDDGDLALTHPPLVSHGAQAGAWIHVLEGVRLLPLQAG
jgi:carbon starvation protein